MKAWLVTWLSGPPEYILAVVSSRRSPESVASLVEVLFESSRYGVAECVLFANKRRTKPSKAQTPVMINRWPHTDRILCGNGPWIYARKVRDLKVKVDPETNDEIVTWVEPDEMSFPPKMPALPVVSRAGDRKTLRRRGEPLIPTRRRSNKNDP